MRTLAAPIVKTMFVVYSTPQWEPCQACRPPRRPQWLWNQVHLKYSAGPSALRRLRPVLQPGRPVRPRRRVQPPLRPLRAAASRSAHEPRVMLDLHWKCNVHTAICVQYRVGATAAQAGSNKETQRSKNTKFEIEAQLESFDIVYRYRKSIYQYQEFFDIWI
jgi:hypothetical protein